MAILPPNMGFFTGLADAFGPIFNTNFPVYNSSNQLVGHVNSAADLASGNVNFLDTGYPLSQLQVVNFWGMLQPAGDYLKAQGLLPSWSDDPFVSTAPAGQSPVDLLFQPASEDQWSHSVAAAADDAVSAINPFSQTDWTTVAIWGGAAILGVLTLKRIMD